MSFDSTAKLRGRLIVRLISCPIQNKQSSEDENLKPFYITELIVVESNKIYFNRITDPSNLYCKSRNDVVRYCCPQYFILRLKHSIGNFETIQIFFVYIKKPGKHCYVAEMMETLI